MERKYEKRENIKRKTQGENGMSNNMFERECKNRACLDNRCLDLYHKYEVERIQFCYNGQKFKGCDKKQ